MRLDLLAMSRTFGDALKAARLKAGLTQDQLRERLKLKDQSNVSQYEQRRYPPRGPTVHKFAAALGCDPAELLADVITPWGVPLCTDVADASGVRDHPRVGEPTGKKRRVS